MAQKKEAPLSLKIAQEIVYGLAHCSPEQRSQYADFYLNALYDACSVQSINQEEYKVLRAIVGVFISEA